MKSLHKIFCLAALLFLAVLAIPGKSWAQGGASISFQEFYDQLQPYGTWVDDPDYGDVWVPDVDEDFRPYATNGHWVLTDYGNTWVSDYDWGWATFHYGRWRYDDYYGWEWVPGYEWGPAWVSWRDGDGYYGWAPLSPGIDIDASFGYNAPDFYWTFAPQAYITSPVIYNYYVPRTRVVNIIRNTTYIRNVYSRNNLRYIAGPHRDDIQRRTRGPVNIYHINNTDRPGRPSVGGNAVNIYRPNVNRQPNARPARSINANDYRTRNPNNSIAAPNRDGYINRQNAERLAQEARNAQQNNQNNRPNRTNVPNGGGQPHTDINNRNPQQDQQRQQQDQQRQQQWQQQRDQNNQRQQQQEQQRQQRTLQDQQRQQDQQRRNNPQQQQQDQQRQQQLQQQQNDQRRQQWEQQRQQRQQQQDQQMQQQRQQQDQQRQQQMQQQRQQQEQQRQQQMQQQRQQQEQQRQQQQQQQRPEPARPERP